MTDLLPSSLTAVAALGAFHGLNPGMGWLFAVALGMQEGRRQAVWRALVPLALGHAAAIGAVVALAMGAGMVAPQGWVVAVAGGALVAAGVMRLVRQRHPRWVGMRVGFAGLTAWSALMATAHGAGLMVLPFVLPGAGLDASAHCHMPGAGGPGLLAVTLSHGAGYLVVTAALAAVVFEKVGLGLLRRAWVNLDTIWAVALIVTGLLTLFA
jgi:hypothetical protein